MKKRVGVAYIASVVLAIAAFVLLMLKVLGPSTRWATLSLYLLGWVFLIYAVRRHARVRVPVRLGARRVYRWVKEWQHELIALTALVVFGALGLILMPPNENQFLTEPAHVTRNRVADGRQRVLRAARGLSDRAAQLERLSRERDPSRVEDHKSLRAAWASYLDFAIEMDSLIDQHKYFYQINPSRLREERATSFLIAFAALTHQVDTGFRVREAVEADPGLVTLLDEGSPEFGVPPKGYFSLVQGLTRADTLVRIEAGLAYYALLKGRGHFRSGEDEQLATQARRAGFSVLKRMGKNLDVLVDNPLDYFESMAFAAWFPLQAKVAGKLGDIRVQERPNFIDVPTLRELKHKLQPMDVLLERRNWYVTNIGLPGFWPHAALFVGDPEQLDAHFDPALVQVRTSYPRVSEYLRAEHPATWDALATKDEHGDPMSVLEAISEGVLARGSLFVYASLVQRCFGRAEDETAVSLPRPEVLASIDESAGELQGGGSARIGGEQRR